MLSSLEEYRHLSTGVDWWMGKGLAGSLQAMTPSAVHTALSTCGCV